MTKVIYKIQTNSQDLPLEILIDIIDLEQYGLKDYLCTKGYISKGDLFDVIDRKIIHNSKHLSRSNDKRSEYNKSNNYKPLKDKRFRVNLHSVAYFRNENYPKYIDLTAPTKGKAIMTAMNRVGLSIFPEGWRGMEVIFAERLHDFGQYKIENSASVYS